MYKKRKIETTIGFELHAQNLLSTFVTKDNKLIKCLTLKF